MKPILRSGGGGHCKACIDVIEQEGKYQIVGIIDLIEKAREKILGYSIIGTDDDLPELIKEYQNALITVGQIKSANSRKNIYEKLKKLNARLPVLKSPLSYVSKHATLLDGTIVMHHAIVNAEVKVGRNCIINSNALVEHESTIGDFCHISTSASINGQVNIGKECFVGSGSTIVNNITITDKVIIPAGKTVYKSISKHGIYLGK